MKHVKIPYGLVFIFYWKKLLTVSLIWFIYDVSYLLHVEVLTLILQ